MSTQTEQVDDLRPSSPTSTVWRAVDAPSGIYIEGVRVIEDPPLADRFVTDDSSGTWISVVPSVEPISAKGEQLVASIRALPAATGR